MVASWPIVLALEGCGSRAPAPWRAGELYVEQIGLGSGSIGESALVVGPDGTTVLVDVGNDAHADAVAEAVERATGARSVDVVVLTHVHADHVGGMSALAVDVGRVVSRGPFDLDPADANADEWAEVHGLRSELAFVDLCEGPEEAPADLDASGGPWPATGCPGLAAPGETEGPGLVPLGDGAEVRLLVADGFTRDDHLGPGVDENARSVGGIVKWGDFVYWFGGDLTGGGKGTPDVEGWLAGALSEEDVPARGVDVLHLHHHGIASSTSAAWVDRMLPEGGGERDAIVGATGAYLDAPSAEALATVAPRLDGGRVWATEHGWIAGDDADLRVEHGSVVFRVTEAGGSAIFEQ